MIELRTAFKRAYSVARGIAAAMLLICSISYNVAASPISVLDPDAVNSLIAQKSGPRAESLDPLPHFRAPIATAASGAASVSEQSNANGDVMPPTVKEPASTVLPDRRNAAASDTRSTGETLRDVLQSIITWHSAKEKAKPARLSRQGRTSPSSGDDGDDEPAVDLRKLILDSEVAGAMLRAIIDIKSADSHGATFSIFGLGNFAFDVAPELHAAIVSELTSGMAFRMSLSGERLGYDRYPEAALNGGAVAGLPHENVNLVRLIWNWCLDFLFSPVGALLSMSAAITLVLWICVKSAMFLQRRASRY